MYKYEMLYDPEQVVQFLNKKKLSRDNIIGIVHHAQVYILFYFADAEGEV